MEGLGLVGFFSMGGWGKLLEMLLWWRGSRWVVAGLLGWFFGGVWRGLW